MRKTTFQRSTSIILAIASKDLNEAIKNRTLLMIVLGMMILMLTGPLLSLLTHRMQPMLVMDESTDAQIIQALQERDDLRLVLVDSAEEMETAILQPAETILGVVVPSQVSASVYPGYTAHWVSEKRLQERVVFFQEALSEASGKDVLIDMQGHRLYPSMDDGYQFTMTGMLLTTIILLMGLALVPYLFIEEKESHTIEALLVSPAHLWQLVAGKIIAGAVYCLIGAAIILVIHFRLVLHWELMLTTVFLATALAVAVGLLMGMLFENAASMGLWTSLLTFALLIAPLVETMGAGKLPAVLMDILAWLPSTVIYNLAILSMLGEVPAGTIWQGILLLVGTTLVLCLLVVWRLRRMDR